MQELVNWPGHGGDWQDSGEGGLFAWMIVPEALSDGEAYGANAYGNNCHVDVSAYLSRPRLMLNRPDVCVSPEGRKVFTAYKHKDSWFDYTMQLGKILDDKNPAHQKIQRAVFETLGGDDISVPMLASVFLGSDGASLYSARYGGYFTVTKDDLTLTGKTLYNGFQEAYGVDPIILTFLDT